MVECNNLWKANNQTTLQRVKRLKYSWCIFIFVYKFRNKLFHLERFFSLIAVQNRKIRTHTHTHKYTLNHAHYIVRSKFILFVITLVDVKTTFHAAASSNKSYSQPFNENRNKHHQKSTPNTEMEWNETKIYISIYINRRVHNFLFVLFVVQFLITISIFNTNKFFSTKITETWKWSTRNDRESKMEEKKTLKRSLSYHPFIEWSS